MSAAEDAIMDDEAWRVGLYDAHCHPTDIMAATDRIATMKAKALTIMATRAQDQDLVVEVAKKYPIIEKKNLTRDDQGAKFAVPSFGWHPWFAHQMYDDRDDDAGSSTLPGRREHYRKVLSPAPKDEDNEFLDNMPAPRSLKQFLQETEERLLAFPLALIGEIGLDRSFRVPVAPHHPPGDTSLKTGIDGGGGSSNGNDSEEEKQYTPGSREGRSLTPFHVKMDHQRLVLKAQLELAAKHGRAVSVHSVATHGVVFDLLQSLWKGHEKLSKSALKRKKRDAENEAHGSIHGAEDPTPENNNTSSPSSSTPPYPARICLHSYSGPVDSLSQFLNPRIPATIYFSFSQLVNFGAHNSDKGVEVIRRVPEDRILIESDLHCAGEVMDELLQNVLERVCEIRGWEVGKGAEIVKANWERLIFGEV